YLNRQDSSWGRVGIYNSPWKGTFRFEKRQDGSYNIKNTHDNQYMYLHTDNKPYINKDGKPDNLNAQWIVIGLPESYPPNGQYQVMEVGLKFGPDGVVLLGHFSSGDPVRIYLTRQADDSYMLKLGDNYIRSNKVDQTLMA